MNEMSILMHLLSEQKNLFQIGATKKEILDKMSIPSGNRDSTIYFNDLLLNLAKYIEPLGLQVQFNPIDSHWYVCYESDISDLISANPFENKPRLAASLFCIIMCTMKNSGVGKISEIKEMRKKKDILPDLMDLEEMGYIQINKELNQVKLTPLIGYKLDMEKLFVNLSLKLKN